jgi:hypothetical protein
MIPKIINFYHLQQVEESYLEHLKFGLWAFLVLSLLALLSLIHAILPFFIARWPDRLYKYFQEKSKARIEKVSRKLQEKNLEADE